MRDYMVRSVKDVARYATMYRVRQKELPDFGGA